MSNSDSQKSVRHRAPIPKDQCPMALAAEILGDRWTLLILREAFYGVQRYDDMRQDLGAPRAMLTDRLSKLSRLEIIERHPYQETGDRVRYAYRLTDAGRGLAKVLVAMSEWGEAYITRIPAPVRLVDKLTGQPLQTAFVTEDGKAVPDVNATLKARQVDDA